MQPYTAKIRGHDMVIDASMMHRPALHVPAGDLGPASLPIKLLQGAVRLLFGLLFRVRIEGRQYIPRHPVIICFNHLGWTEGFLILLYFPVEPRIYGIGHQYVSELSGFRHWFMDKIQVMIPMDVAQPDPSDGQRHLQLDGVAAGNVRQPGPEAGQPRLRVR